MQSQIQSNIYLLADWEKDAWKRVYFSVARGGIFTYTFDKNDALLKSFELSLGEIHTTTIKMPKRAKRKLIDNTEAVTTVTTATNDTKSTSDHKTETTDEKREKRSSSQTPRSRIASTSPVPMRRAMNRSNSGQDSIYSFSVFDQDKTHDGGYDSAIDEDREPYYVKLLNKDKHEVG